MSQHHSEATDHAVTPDGRVMHYFVKIDGQWLCKICDAGDDDLHR